MHVANDLAVRTIQALLLQHEGNEPPHVHMQRERMLAKFWLEPIRLGRSTGFAPEELRRIERVVTENRRVLLEAWNVD